MAKDNGKVPADQQPDETVEMALDTKIGVNEDPKVLPRVNIDEPVVPGHDMVVNHIDGTQELAQGHVAAGIHAQEAETQEVVRVADFKAGKSDENPRDKDPEVNGPDQEAVASDQATTEVVDASQPDVSPNEVTPASPTTEKVEEAEPVEEVAPAQEEVPAEPTAPAPES